MIKSICFMIVFVGLGYYIGAGVIDIKSSLTTISATLDSTSNMLDEMNSMLKDMNK